MTRGNEKIRERGMGNGNGKSGRDGARPSQRSTVLGNGCWLSNVECRLRLSQQGQETALLVGRDGEGADGHLF